VFGAAGCDMLDIIYGENAVNGAPVEDAAVTHGSAANWAIDIGTGASTFIPLTDNEEVARVHGPQGGEHVWISLRIAGDVSEDGQLELGVRAGNTAVSRSVSMVSLTGDPASAGTKTVTGQRAFVDTTTSGSIIIDVKLIDPDAGAWASASRPLVLL